MQILRHFIGLLASKLREGCICFCGCVLSSLMAPGRDADHRLTFGEIELKSRPNEGIWS